MEAGGGDEDDTDIAQLWEELPELANAREATAAFTFDPETDSGDDVAYFFLRGLKQLEIAERCGPFALCLSGLSLA